MPGQRPVREPEPARLVDHVHDPRRVEPPHAERADVHRHDLALRDRRARLDRRPRRREHPPPSQILLRPREHRLAPTEPLPVVIEREPGWGRPVVRGADRRVRHGKRALRVEEALHAGGMGAREVPHRGEATAAKRPRRGSGGEAAAVRSADGAIAMVLPPSPSPAVVIHAIAIDRCSVARCSVARCAVPMPAPDVCPDVASSDMGSPDVLSPDILLPEVLLPEVPPRCPSPYPVPWCHRAWIRDSARRASSALVAARPSRSGRPESRRPGRQPARLSARDQDVSGLQAELAIRRWPRARDRSGRRRACAVRRRAHRLTRRRDAYAQDDHAHQARARARVRPRWLRLYGPGLSSRHRPRYPPHPVPGAWRWSRAGESNAAVQSASHRCSRRQARDLGPGSGRAGAHLSPWPRDQRDRRPRPGPPRWRRATERRPRESCPCHLEPSRAMATTERDHRVPRGTRRGST